MADSKEIPKGVDLGVFRKLAQRVEKTLEEQVINKEPKTINPRFVLIAPLNRDGSPPNVPYLHHTLIKNILIKGFGKQDTVANILDAQLRQRYQVVWTNTQ